MKRSLAIAAVILAVLLGGQGQAVAAGFEKGFEDDQAVITADSGTANCLENWAILPVVGYVMTAKGCFTKNGDVWYVQDAFPDGSQAFIYWENWLYSGSGPEATWKPYRYGECTNSLNAPNWGKCNKDYYEASSTNFYGGKGSLLRFQICRRVPGDNVCNPATIQDAPLIYNNG